MSSRLLTSGEVALARPVFRAAIDYSRVRLHHRKWWLLQPVGTTMSPDGALWFHPKSPLWREDFAAAPLGLQGHLIHELTHVWQAQRGGRWFLPLARHPFCHYRYALKPGRAFRRYGLEQQAEIVRHAFLARMAGRPDPTLEALLPF